MTVKGETGKKSAATGLLLAEWLDRLASLTKLVKSWAEELDWSTRQIDKKVKDSRLGTYDAPALLMQRETTRVLLDPIARFAPGTEGVVDLYLMPAYDDIASLCFVNGEWRLQYMLPGTGAAVKVRGAESNALSKEVLNRVLDEMSKHAASAF